MSNSYTLRYADDTSEEAKREDTRRLFRLAVQAHEEVGLPQDLAPFDPGIAMQSIYECITHGCFLIMEHEGEIVGALGLMQYRLWYSQDPVLTDGLFFIKPEHRGGEAFGLFLNEVREIASDLGIAVYLTVPAFNKAERPARNGLERIASLFSYLPQGRVFQIAPAKDA